jgi:hypothetical protein
MIQSRWADDFNSHSFQSTWTKIKNDLINIEVDDQTVLTAVTELARLKKVIAYLDEIISTINPELTPVSVWNNFDSQALKCHQVIGQFKSTRSTEHIKKANDHADNLLTYVRPYMVLPQEVLGALQKSALSYVAQLDHYIDTFQKKSKTLLDEIKSNTIESDSKLLGLNQSAEKIDTLCKRLFEGTSDVIPIQKQIDIYVAEAEKKTKQIEYQHQSICVDLPDKKSIKTLTKNAEIEILGRLDAMYVVMESANKRISELDIFYDKIFGEPVNDEDKKITGLKFELNNRLKQLDILEIQHKTKHKALIEEIETLLPGATSAGLATSYETLTLEFDGLVKRHTWIFYSLLVSISFVTLAYLLEFKSSFPYLIWSKVQSWDEILRGIFEKAGFYIPMIWLALFSATRRSQYERLKQEYAHKKAFASSYESYKKQLQDLKSNAEDLQRELISKAVEAIAYNASSTLDGKHHSEKTPVAQLLEKANLESLMKLLDTLKNSKTPAEK